MIDPKEPNNASVRAFFLSAALTAIPPPGATEIDAARGGVDGPLASGTGVVLLDGALGAGGGVDDGLEILFITEQRRASAFNTLLGFRGVVFSTATEWVPGLGLELCSGGVVRAKMG